MRRWHLLSRLSHFFDPGESGRCILVVEQLEEREVPSVFVSGPGFEGPVSITEDTPYFFRGSDENAFFVFDMGGDQGQAYVATLTADKGTIVLDEASTESFGVTVDNNGTPAVTLTGQIEQITSVLISFGFAYDPTFYSGDATVTVTVTDTTDPDNSDSDSVDFQVFPVVSPAFLDVQASGEVRAPATGFVFPPGFVSIVNWNDADGSETVNLTLSVEGQDATGFFTLSANGVVIDPVEPNLWQLSGNNPAAFQALLDSLVLTPPADFTGRAFVNVFGNITDTAVFFPTDDSFFGISDNGDLGFRVFDIRFFIGGSISASPVLATEGDSAIDLGGRFTVADPDEQFGDIHTLALTVPSGTLLFNEAAVPEGLSVGSAEVSDGSMTIFLDGTVDAINAFLATPGSITYVPVSATFSGVVPLTLVFINSPGFGEGTSSFGEQSPAEGSVPAPVIVVVPLTFAPVPSSVFPSASDAVTDQDTPVPIFITLTPLADTDGSESVLVVLEGVPAGASFNRGTDIGAGQWAFAPSDLADLTFTPPPGESGVFSFGVKAVVTDSAPGVAAATATQSTTFNVTVNPAPVAPPPVAPPPADPVPDPDPPPVMSLPPSFDIAIALTTPVLVTTAFEEMDMSSEDGDEPGADFQENTVTFIDAGSFTVSPELVLSSAGERVSLVPQAQGSLFSQPESPQPAYAGGEKHPLPPVLPLDQTLPVAGFTESGGDSIALVDKIYRDANGKPGEAVSQVPDPANEANETPAAAETNTKGPNEPATPKGDAPEGGAGAGAEAPAEKDRQFDWRLWGAGSVVAASLAAWVWLSRGPDRLLTRAARWLLRLPHRPTERTA